jgi:hypothetical protein
VAAVADGDRPELGRRPPARRGLRGAGEVAGRCEALLGALGQRTTDDRIEGGGACRQRGRRLGELRPQLGVLPLGRERDVAGEHEEEQSAERIHVDAGVGALAADLLRRGEVGRAHPMAVAGRGAVAAEGRDEAEVGQVRVVVRVDQHVARLDVAVHEAGPVGGVECRRDLPDEAQRSLLRECALAPDEREQVVSDHEPHRDEGDVPLLAGRIHGDDVRVLDRGGRTRLPHETRSRLRVVDEVRGDDLQCHDPLQRELGRAVDDPHPAAADDGRDAVSPEDLTGREPPHHPDSTICAGPSLDSQA